jgi:hypothetical protein
MRKSTGPYAQGYMNGRGSGYKNTYRREDLRAEYDEGFADADGWFLQGYRDRINDGPDAKAPDNADEYRYERGVEQADQEAARRDHPTWAQWLWG